jgi:alkylation response protein AidB-like acyl-CoA dehydrogenase
MALAITEDHQALADVVRSFTANNQLRKYSRAALDTSTPELPDLWKQLADLGWLGLHIAEEHGGSGYTVAELAVVLDELGYGIVPAPFLSTVIASAVIAQHGSAAQQAALLPGLVDGSVIGAVGFAPGASAAADGSLTATVKGVLGGRWAQLLLIAVDEDVVVVRADDASVTVAPVAGIDPSLGLSTVTFNVSKPAADTVLRGAAVSARSLFRAIASAEAAGGSRASLDMALEYSKVREQFGRIIGSFQAIKHHLANMLVSVELATAVSWDAVRSTGDGDQGRLAAAAAANLAFDTYQGNAEKAIQILGGIGFTWEHDAHLFFRRAAALSSLVGQLGSPADDVFELSKAGVRRSYGVDLPPEAEDYRAAAVAFLSEYQNAPLGERREVLVRSGYMVPHWGKPYGRAAGPVEQLVIEEELSEVESPSLGIGGWVLLTLTQTATEEQIERWIYPSLLGELQWCQLFSEPNAGSDAAAVQTKGVKVEGGWRVTGQKVWTSGAQHCNRGLATIRTDSSAAKHKGITAMVIDLKSPGVEVRPLREITGEAMFNEVFFDDVFVPDADVVGDVNDGWRVARTTLGNERVTIGGGSREGMSAYDLIDLSLLHGHADVEAGRKIAGLIIEEHAMRLVNLRQITRAVVGSGPGPEGNVTKLLSAEHAQRVTELAMEVTDIAGIDGSEANVTFEYLFNRCLSLAGGTSEITRNVIAERILGLPRDALNR